MGAALASVLVGIGLLIYRKTEEKGSETVFKSSGGSVPFQNTPHKSQKKVVTEGDLEPDGSGTLGNGDGNEGDVELSTPNKTDPPTAGDGNFDIGGDDEEEGDKPMTQDDEKSNMEIV